MQKIGDLATWLHMPPESEVEFTVNRPRPVTLQVNAPGETRLYLADGDGELRFLAHVCGRDQIEFLARGPFRLLTSDRECFIRSDDSTTIHAVVEAPESFTKVMNRRHRNPELEAMMRAMKSNFDRQLAKQAEHAEQLIQRSIAAFAPQPAPAAVPARVAGEPAPNADAGASGAPAP